MLPELAAYGLRVLPGLLLIGGCFALARGERDPLLRIVTLILAFVLVRDAMTPMGFWTFGVAGGVVPWLRFVNDGTVLVTFGVVSLAFVAGVLRLDRELRAPVAWGRFDVRTLALGIGGGVLVAAPVLLGRRLWAHDSAPGVPAGLLAALLFLALAGNFAEEVLFRGLLQGRLERTAGPVRAAALSALLFAACHVFLATTVTDVGLPLLAFTLYEGAVCALVRMRRGVVPAALSHGLGIFLIASGVL
ncbi:MAG: CPBP family glutamic-type intramembrane protease [Actinomycetes bacterium]|nr:MAG: CPBP family intramembrane metalloprotease [Actinomycetota bacterium]